jgi:hypothetical protein
VRAGSTFAIDRDPIAPCVVARRDRDDRATTARVVDLSA